MVLSTHSTRPDVSQREGRSTEFFGGHLNGFLIRILPVFATSRFQVRSPTLPVCSRPTLRWKRFTALRVGGPKYPVIRSVFITPAARSRRCRATMWLPVWPYFGAVYIRET